jgi:galactokinase
MPSKTRTYRAPGRVNIIGEHIDYLGGTVLPFACDLELIVEASPATSIGGFGELARPFVHAVAAALEEAGAVVLPREGSISSTIPIGAGLSSSSALAAALAFALTDGVKPTPTLLFRAEQIATGVPGGLMDQTAILESREGHALLLDCATGSFEHVPIPGQIGFVVIDTGTRRALADGRYAARRAEVEAGEPRRVRHAESEQRRVYDAVDAIRAADVAALGALISDSHASLRDDFEVSSEALDAAVASAEAHPSCHGARLVGAGFAGCVLAIVDGGRERAVAGEFERAWPTRPVDGAGPA